MDIDQQLLTSRLERLHLFFKNNDKKIEEIFQNWYFNRENFEMYIEHPIYKHLKFKTIDIEKAKLHYKLIELYNFITFYDYKFYLNWHIEKYNYFDYERGLEKYNRICNIIENGNILLKSLNIEQNFDQLYNDFYGNRKLMRKIFQNILSKYGIILHDSALKVIFGKFKYYKTNTVDAILIITFKTYFYKSLRDQFGGYNYPTGIFSAFFMRASGLLNEQDNYISYNEEIPNFNDPFLQEKRIIKMFIKASIIKEKNGTEVPFKY